jgi:hypothetical protein
VLFSLGSVSGQYAVLAYRMGHHLPGGLAAVLLALYWSPLVLTFPDDHPALPGRDFAVAALAAALEPAHVSVWVRPPE